MLRVWWIRSAAEDIAAALNAKVLRAAFAAAFCSGIAARTRALSYEPINSRHHLVFPVHDLVFPSRELEVFGHDSFLAITLANHQQGVNRRKEQEDEMRKEEKQILMWQLFCFNRQGTF